MECCIAGRNHPAGREGALQENGCPEQAAGAPPDRGTSATGNRTERFPGALPTGSRNSTEQVERRYLLAGRPVAGTAFLSRECDTPKRKSSPALLCLAVTPPLVSRPLRRDGGPDR